MKIDEFCLACYYGKLDEVREAIAQGFDVTAAEPDGWTALHSAVGGSAGGGATDRLPIVDLLLERGARIEVRNKEGMTPLFLAAKSGNYEVVARLIQKGADVNARDDVGLTPLLMSLTDQNSASHFQVMELLLNKGADIESKDSGGWTPLHLAARNKNVTGAKLLLKHGARVNSLEARGWTPLQLAKNAWGDEGTEIQNVLRAAGGTASQTYTTSLLKSYGHVLDAIIRAASYSEVTQTPYGSRIELYISGHELELHEFSSTGTFKVWWNGREMDEGNRLHIESRLSEIVNSIRAR